MLRQSLLCAALVVVGCGRASQEESFRAALPTKDLVEVKAPKSGSQALAAEVHGQAGQGQTSDLYQLTRAATVTVNGGTFAVLALLDAVTKFQPTSIQGDTAVWGPHTDAQSPNTWKLTVKKTGANTYSYTLDAKGKTEADSAFRTVLSGKHTARTDGSGEPVAGFGSGDFTLDWDKAATLPEHDNNVGKMTVTYSRKDDTSPATLDADFRNVKDGNDATKRVDVRYGYKATPNAGGEFDFVLLSNMFGSLSTPERLSIKSRWQQTGAGRSDVKLSGGDLPGTAEVNECWDATFASRYLRASYDPRLGYGTEATDCVFNAAVYSAL